SFVVTNPTEEAVTNGIIRVAGATKKVVYFTDGHGEADIQNQQDAKGYASAKLALEQENYEVKPLVLLEQIPDDASTVVMAGLEPCPQQGRRPLQQGHGDDRRERPQGPAVDCGRGRGEAPRPGRRAAGGSGGQEGAGGSAPRRGRHAPIRRQPGSVAVPSQRR